MFPAPDGAYLLALTLENARCFKDRQVLRVANDDGTPARWTVILGENGTGKTTLLWGVLGACSGWNGEDYPYRTLERMHPGDRAQSHPPLRELRVEWTDGVSTYSTRGGRGSASGRASRSRVIGYGASRRIRPRGLTGRSGPVDTLLDADAALLDPEAWLLRLHYDALLAPEGPAARRLQQAIDALVSLLPDVSGVELPQGANGSALEGHGDRVKFLTPYGAVPLSGLSLGYQTMLAWTIDLAARLFDTYPDREDPLTGPAVVLVDELDLHLHPSWQRTLIGFLTQRFPAVQFVATAHSPLVVQAAEAANLALLRREGDRVVIDNDPTSVHGWRVDQILTSELFGLDSARPPREARLLAERAEILARRALDAPGKRRLEEIEAELDQLPTADGPEDRAAMDLIRRAAEALQQSGQT